MIAYRIEDSDGYGPWAGSTAVCCDPAWFAAEPGSMPTPDADGIDDVARALLCYRHGGRGVRYGFRSLRHLARWFPPVLRRVMAREYGFTLAVYAVEGEHFVGGCQIVAAADGLRLCARLDLETLEEQQ